MYSKGDQQPNGQSLTIRSFNHLWCRYRASLPVSCEQGRLVNNRHASHRRTPYRRTSHRSVYFTGHASQRRASYGYTFHGRASHVCASYENASPVSLSRGSLSQVCAEQGPGPTDRPPVLHLEIVAFILPIIPEATSSQATRASGRVRRLWRSICSCMRAASMHSMSSRRVPEPYKKGPHVVLALGPGG